MPKKKLSEIVPIAAQAPAALARVLAAVPKKTAARKKTAEADGAATALSQLAAAAAANGHGGETPRDEVARRAYYLWLERGCPAGTAEQDWLAAERELQKA